MTRKSVGISTQKKLAQRVHAKQRAQQRYGFVLNRHQYRDVVLQIQNGVAKKIEKQGLGRSVFEVNVDDRIIPVVYDSTTKSIVTFLPTMLDEIPDLVEAEVIV